MRKKEAWLLGIGFDGGDGHQRITHGENLILVGGSSQTHELLQDQAMIISQELKRRGQDLDEFSIEQIRTLLQEAMENR